MTSPVANPVEPDPKGVPDPGLPIAEVAQRTTYLIVVELLTNVTRHAVATSCRVEFAANGPDLLVRVIDDGRGLPADHRLGDGLLSAVERAESAGGRLVLANRHSGGTQAAVYAPGWRP